MDAATANRMMIWMAKISSEGYSVEAIYWMTFNVLTAIESGAGTKDLSDQEAELYSRLSF